MFLDPTQHARLARRHLTTATQHQQEAQHQPDDYRADLAARTHARDAYRHAQLAELAPPPPGVIIHTRAAH